MAVASIGAAVSLHSSQSTSFSAIISPERISFNKVSLYHRNVSSAAGAKVAPIRAQVTTDTPKEPYIGKCLLNTKITGDDAPGETWHMVFSHEGEVPYTEGQSIGIIPEGIDKNGKPHKLRLYSIARSALGDLGDSKTVLGI